MNIDFQIERLIQYAIRKGMIHKLDEIESRNRVLEILGNEEFSLPVEDIESIKKVDTDLEYPSGILNNILDYAYSKGILEENGSVYRDLLDSKIMGALTPATSQIVREFDTLKEKSLEKATDYYYELSKSSNYIRTDRIAKNQHWYSETEYGNLEVTINLSKPEKDPKAIAAAKNMPSSSYPKCLLCKENVGYSGRINHPGRQNHRVLPLELQGKSWNLQYSPYVYYNEHSIIFSSKHEPMSISEDTFDKLLEFTEKFPHYFCGSNADLPIVGGSILSHDHFQGGKHEFPMDKAKIEKEITFKGYEDVKAGIVKWPMSVIRISHTDRNKVRELGGKILAEWREYTDEEAEVYSHSGDEKHNTITPIARRRGENYELDLVLRNNRTSNEHPMGIFHPHAEVHHIKKENIGLIEVIGLAILPGRLKEELEVLGAYLATDNYDELIVEDDRVVKHLEWARGIKESREVTEETVVDILREEVGKKFATVLEHAGVYKRTEEGKKGFLRFIDKVNN